MTTPPHSKHLAALLDATADYVRTYMVRTSRTSPQDASHARRTSRAANACNRHEDGTAN